MEWVAAKVRYFHEMKFNAYMQFEVALLTIIIHERDQKRRR